MPLYSYTALKSGKDIVKGTLQADSLKEARESLRNSNLIPTKIEETKDKSKSSSTNGPANLFSKFFSKKSGVKLKKLKMREKIDFTNSLFFLSKTGIPLVEALLFIENNAGTKRVKMLCNEVRKSILVGNSFSESLSKYERIFDKIYIGLVRAGEESGELETTLERLVELLEKQKSLKEKIVTVMVYPVFIVFLALAVSIIMLTFVFPAFKQVYEQMGKKLPQITVLFMNTGVFLHQNMYVIPFVFIFVWLFFIGINKWSVSKRFIDKTVLKIPVFQKFVTYASLSNYLAVMQISFDAGITIVDSIILANQTLENVILIDRLKPIPRKIQLGQTLTDSLKETQIVPGVLMCMIATGEHAGQLGTLLHQATQYIDSELDRIIDMLSRLLEPILLVVIGFVVLMLALALYLPLFTSYSNIVS